MSQKIIGYNKKPKVAFMDGKYVNFSRIKGQSPEPDNQEKKPKSNAVKSRNRVIIPAQFVNDPYHKNYTDGDRREYGRTIDIRSKLVDPPPSVEENPFQRKKNSYHPNLGRTKPAKKQSRGVRQKHHMEQTPEMRKLSSKGYIDYSGNYRAGKESLYTGKKKPQVLLRFENQTHTYYDRKLHILIEEKTPFRWHWQAGGLTIKVFGVKQESEYRAELIEEMIVDSAFRNGKRQTQIVHKLRVFGYGMTPTEAVNDMLHYPALFHPETNSKWSLLDAFKSICIVFPDDKKPLPQMAQESLRVWHTQVEWRRDHDIKGYVPLPFQFPSRKVPRSMYTPQSKLNNEHKPQASLSLTLPEPKPIRKIRS